MISVQISPGERDVLMQYTDTPLKLVKRIDDAIAQARSKRAIVKRVTVHYSLQELNTIITKIAEKANQRKALEDTQYTLGALFGRLATKYNLAINS